MATLSSLLGTTFVGSQGVQGTAATISIGTVTTGSVGSNANVTNSGTSGAAVFDFTIPVGATGATGATGAAGPSNIPSAGAAKTTSYTLQTSDVGDHIVVESGGSITIPDATFSAGDASIIFNNSNSDITITCSITTAYIAGTDTDVASVVLATRGLASILFISGTICVIGGNVS